MSKAPHLMQVGARDAGYKDGTDYYATPPVAVEALLRVEAFGGPVWEPACGDGAISKVLLAHGIDTFSTDLMDCGFGAAGIDFLLCNGAAANIVTNPPYNKGEAFARHAVTLATGKVCFLMRLAWLAGQRRHKMFVAQPLARIWVFSGRLPRMHRHDYEGPKTTSTIDFAWFVWDKNAPEGAPQIGWL